MGDRRMSTAEAAASVGVSPNTVKTWIKEVPLAPERDERGNYRWGPAAIAALRTVKAMRDEDRGMASIRVTIAPPPPEGESEVTREAPPMDHGSPVVDSRAIAAAVFRPPG